MAKKETTGKKTTRKKTTKKATRRKKKTTKKATSAEESTDLEALRTDEDDSEATTKAAKKKTGRRKTTKASRKTAARRKRKATTGGDDTTTEQNGDDGSRVVASRTSAAEAVSPGASVEEQNGAIVIRFPPVAPPPFAARAAEASSDEDDQDEAATVVEPETRFEPEPEPAPAPEPTIAEEAPAAPERDDDAETAGETMSRSKKRRLRRRRRKDTPEAESRGKSAERGGKPKADSAADTDFDEPVGTTDLVPEEATRVETEPTSDEAADDPTPWLAAAESIKAGLKPPPEPVETETGDDEEAGVATAEAPEPPEEEAAEEAAPPQKKTKRRRRRGRRSRRDEAEKAAEEDEEVSAAKSGVVREMIINTVPREECRIAVLCDGRLEEIYLERATSENHVGNIYKGVVTNVEASIQAAFIDFGQGKNGFLHISDLHPQYFPNGQGQTENVGHKMPRRHRPPIQRCLKRGQQVVVQVTKEGIGTKGPTLSTYLSIPGRFLVMMPGMGRLGVSRRIEDDDARSKLRGTLSDLELPEGMGFIARTAAMGRTKRELQGDLTYLSRLWRAVEKRMKNERAPAELYRESDLVIRTIRDVFTSDVERIVVDDAEVADRARDFLSIFSPRSADIIGVYDKPQPIFHKYGIEAELERLHSRRVPLNSGGSLVIEPTEALVAIDVNSGRFRTEDDAETTAYKINIEAADEIARQLRLRDLGGVVVCDFIDMRQESHRRDIERRLARNLKDHKERAKVLRTSEFGIIELTRQRQRASLTRSVYQDCHHCHGTGLVKTIESVALDVMRLVQLAVTRDNIHTIEVSVSPDVAFLLQNRKRRLLHELESNNRRIISIRPDPGYSLDQVDIRCTDPRGRLVPHNT